MLGLVLAGCQDGPLTVQPAEDLVSVASAAPSTVRTPAGDFITGDAVLFAQALKDIGPDGEVLVWLKEPGMPRPSAEFLLNLPGSATETIALPTEAPGAQRRNHLGAASVNGASVDAVVSALTRSGVGSVERLDALPVLIVRMAESSRVGALNALLRHPNVDYVSAARVRPVELTAAPVGSNPIDAKHTVHNIPQAWDLTRGSGGKVGILDSGLARSTTTGGFHSDGQNFGTHGIVPLGFVDDECGTSTANYGGCVPYDDGWRDGSFPHGTGAAGLVGQNDNDYGHVGIAPHATTYSMKIWWNTHIGGHCGDNIFSDTGGCVEDDDFIRAVNYGASRRMHVLSMSFSGSFGSDVYRALATARNSYGVLLVASAGNLNTGCGKEPASFDVVMSVAAVDAAGNNNQCTSGRDVSGYFGGGSLGATCYKYSYCDAGNPGIMGGIGGTSAAAANVAGIVGLIRSYHPSESVSQIWNRLVSTAEGPNRVVNAYAAITYRAPLAVGISGPTMVPAYTDGYWSATAANGTAPYSYTWYRDGVAVGTGSTYSGTVMGQGFQLQVVATDAAAASASRSIYVSVEDPNCGTYQPELCQPML